MKYRSAFTLIEILLVVVIMFIAAAIGIPLLQGTLDNQRLQAAAEQLRGEFIEARLTAMEDGQIVCLRCRLGGSEIIVDRILDAHFTAGLSSRDATNRYDVLNELDPFEKGVFTGETQDFILRDPSQASEDTGTKMLKLPGSVFTADVISLPEERSAFYLGLTTAGETETEENTAESEEVANQELRLGETAGNSSAVWSVPIFFYPDGTVSSAAVLLKNNRGNCVEIRLRGLTGIAKTTPIVSAQSYTGELDATREAE
ncbi:MAG: prepilin-type N-terminal cleavage/methylation domain-containing protein [Planctomycetaceae bacterium]|jgi:type II secretory pathway pseudopilin PulG|nr:prepilin-type N-terminal cleavage/methylation domain-containing protein [Planctomycetaceae bacterium]